MLTSSQVVIGNTSDKPVLRNVFFFRLDLSNIIPSSVQNASLINSIAQSIGLHDFYQVGLWNFCEGYDYESVPPLLSPSSLQSSLTDPGSGITACSTPQKLFWFNPVEVIMNELLSGATIAIPEEVMQILNILRIASQIMFGFFITSTVLTFVMIFLSPLALRSRWLSMPLAIAALLTMIMVVTASIIGSVISFVFKYAAEAQSSLNISADVGTEMLVFTWLASGLAVWAFTIHAGLGCCCVSERDLKTGRREVRDGVVQDR
jgi:hypothetical protein